MGGRPGHISPCSNSEWCICRGETLRWPDIADASHAIEVALHKTEDHDQSARLWKAKVLVDQVRNEAQDTGEFEAWMMQLKAQAMNKDDEVCKCGCGSYARDVFGQHVIEPTVVLDRWRVDVLQWLTPHRDQDEARPMNWQTVMADRIQAERDVVAKKFNPMLIYAPEASRTVEVLRSLDVAVGLLQSMSGP